MEHLLHVHFYRAQKLARKAAGMERAWLKPGQSAVVELIAEGADEDKAEGLLNTTFINH